MLENRGGMELPIPPSGVWFVRYGEHDLIFRTRLVCYEDINGKRVIEGYGVDNTTPFSIHGIWYVDNRIMQFIKQFHGGHTEHYFGELSGNRRTVSGHFGYSIIFNMNFLA